MSFGDSRILGFPPLPSSAHVVVGLRAGWTQHGETPYRELGTRINTRSPARAHEVVRPNGDTELAHTIL